MEEKISQILYKNNIIQPLKGFCATVEEGSITKAAEKIGLTQATITRQIQSLERELNINLFDRTKNSISLTADGERLYRLAIVRLKSMETLVSEFIKDKEENEIKTLNIASHHVALSHILPKYIREFRNIEPDVKINLYNINREEALEKLKNYEVDFALYPFDAVPVEFYSRTIFEYEP